MKFGGKHTGFGSTIYIANELGEVSPSRMRDCASYALWCSHVDQKPLHPQAKIQFVLSHSVNFSQSLLMICTFHVAHALSKSKWICIQPNTSALLPVERRDKLHCKRSHYTLQPTHIKMCILAFWLNSASMHLNIYSV